MVQKLSRSSSAAVSDFRYDACDEHILFRHKSSLVSLLAGWLNQEQQKILEYLQEENRVLCQNSALLKDHGCNLMHRKVLASFYQHLMAEAPMRSV